MSNNSANQRRMVLLTENHSDPITAKTAVSLLRYCPDEIVAVLDSTCAGQTAARVLGTGGDIPVIANLNEAPNANTLAIGIATSGGFIPEAWRTVILDAITMKMNILSGMHHFLCDDHEFATAAAEHRVQLIDVRKNDEKTVAERVGINDRCLRIHTVGNDCCVGKMVASIELTNALKERGCDAKFVATGQTGMMIAGDGCPLDCVVADFVNGATERLVLANQHHEILLFEGQGSLAHPKYSGVTLGILHGCAPHGLIMCYEVGRDDHHHMTHVPLRPLAELISVYETMASLMEPCKVIGLAMNSRNVTDEEAQLEREKWTSELGIPVCDVFRHGPDDLVDAILKLKAEVIQ